MGGGSSWAILEASFGVKTGVSAELPQSRSHLTPMSLPKKTGVTCILVGRFGKMREERHFITICEINISDTKTPECVRSDSGPDTEQIQIYIKSRG